MKVADIFRFGFGALASIPGTGDVMTVIKRAASFGAVVADFIDAFGEDTAEKILKDVIANPPALADLDPIRDAAAERRAELEDADNE